MEQRIINAKSFKYSEMCLLSFPCQHYCEIDGENIGILGGRFIRKMLIARDEPIEHFNYLQKEDDKIKEQLTQALIDVKLIKIIRVCDYEYDCEYYCSITYKNKSVKKIDVTKEILIEFLKKEGHNCSDIQKDDVFDF